MEETVYQCPECNFNADNLTELDLHLTENHSGEVTATASTITNNKNSTNNKKLYNPKPNKNTFIPNGNHPQHHPNGNHQQIVDNDSYNDDNEILEDDDEDFFNEKNNQDNQDYDQDDDLIINEDNNIHSSNSNLQQKVIFGNQATNHEDFSNVKHTAIVNNYSMPLMANSAKIAKSSPHHQRIIKPKIALNENNIITVNAAAVAAAAAAVSLSVNNSAVLNSDNHYERQYACKRCEFFTNNPRAVLYHRKEFHMEKINVHECTFCQYASQYSGKVERHTMLRHKIDVTSPNKYSVKHKNENNNNSLKKIASTPTTAQALDLTNTPTNNTTTSHATETLELEKSSNSLSLNESFVNLIKHQQLQGGGGDSSSLSEPRNSQYQTYQTRNLNNSFNGIAKFQCNICPCKYKRSNDLSKHLKHKHSIHPTNLSDYLTTTAKAAKDESALDQHISSNDTFADENDFANASGQTAAVSEQNNFNRKQQAARNMINRNFNQVQRRNINQTCRGTFSHAAAAQSPSSSSLSIINSNSNTSINANTSTSNKKHQLPITNTSLSVVVAAAASKSNPAVSCSYECPYCTYYSNGNDAEYLFHVKDHLCGKTFRCVLCNSVYKYRGDCVVHLKRKHQKADTIAHNFVDKFNLDNLDITQICTLLKPKQNDDFENEEKLFGCAYCDYKANYKGDVFKHQTRRHPGTVKSVNSLGPSANASYNNHQSKNRVGCAGAGLETGSGSDAHSSENNSENKFDDQNYENYDDKNEDDEDEDDVINFQDDDENNTNNNNNSNEEDYEDEDFFNERSSEPAHNNNNNSKQVNPVEMNHDLNEEEDDNDDDYEYNEQANMEIIDDFIDQEGGEEDDEEDGADIEVEEEEEEEEEDEEQHILDSLKNDYQNTQQSKSHCKFCSFIAKSPAKLQLHLATHYNLKPFMCPVCKRRANFKWDIQKHLRKIHNDHQSEVICLSESDARQSINSYIEHKQFVHNNNANSIIYENSIEKVLKPTSDTAAAAANENHLENESTENEQVLKTIDSNRCSIKNELIAESDEDNNENITTSKSAGENNMGQINGNGNQSVNNYSSLVTSPNFRFITGRHNPHSLKERKFKCPMCIRTSKWQWDIKKHMRTVHKGRDGDVIVLKERNYSNLIGATNPHTQNPQQSFISSALNPTLNSSLRSIGGNNTNSHGHTISNSLFKNGIVHNKQQTLSPDSGLANATNTSLTKTSLPPAANPPNMLNSALSIGSDATGNKKFKCSSCPYRSNWKADLIRHIKKRHFITYPTLNNIIILKPDEAAQSLQEYENVHGINIRKRIRITDFNSGGSETEMAQGSASGDDFKRFKADSIYNGSNNSEVDDQATAAVAAAAAGSNEIATVAPEDLKTDLDEAGVERLPVSVAELNIKPYKCLRCGFRSDRKSDTLRHIKVKHNFQQPFSLLKILSIKDASSSIEQYERNKSSKKILRNSAQFEALVNDGNNSLTKPAQSPIQAIANLRKLLPNNWSQQNSQQNHHQAVKSSNDSLDYLDEEYEIDEQRNNDECCSETKTNKSDLVVDYYKCPFCPFKNVNNIAMRRHLFIHYRGETIRINPIYRCNTCSFKSEWQYTVKKHILACHLSQPNVSVLKLYNKELGIIRVNSKPSSKMLFTNSSGKKGGIFNSLQLSNDAKLDGKDSGLEEQEIKSVENDQDHHHHHHHHHTTDTIDENGNFIDDNDENYAEEDEENNENSNLIYDEGNNNSFAEDAKVESTSLTGYDGEKFVASYLVVMATINNVKKKMYKCQSCPYKTNNYCNLKQHLLMHKFQDGFYKCRYCPYYVVKIRLLKQHETLHNDYEPRANSRRRTVAAGVGFAFPKQLNTFDASSRYHQNESF